MGNEYYWEPYAGQLAESNVTGNVKKAVTAFNNQRRRCYTASSPRYKDNGAKGISVEYSLRDFIGWFLHHIELYKGASPSVGRLDHSKNYSFDNIRLESLADNSMERIKRIGTTKPRRAVNIIWAKTNEIIAIASSVLDAAKYTGAKPGHIPKYCRGIHKQTKRGFTFRYAQH